MVKTSAQSAVSGTLAHTARQGDGAKIEILKTDSVAAQFATPAIKSNTESGIIKSRADLTAYLYNINDSIIEKYQLLDLSGQTVRINVDNFLKYAIANNPKIKLDIKPVLDSHSIDNQGGYYDISKDIIVVHKYKEMGPKWVYKEFSNNDMKYEVDMCNQMIPIIIAHESKHFSEIVQPLTAREFAEIGIHHEISARIFECIFIRPFLAYAKNHGLSMDMEFATYKSKIFGEIDIVGHLSEYVDWFAENSDAKISKDEIDFIVSASCRQFAKSAAQYSTSVPKNTTYRLIWASKKTKILAQHPQDYYDFPDLIKSGYSYKNINFFTECSDVILQLVRNCCKKFNKEIIKLEKQTIGYEMFLDDIIKKYKETKNR
jgi:hypothetical protein